jgi:hypothetical protein
MRGLRLLFVALALSVGASAFAANERRHKPSEFQELTEEEKAALKEKNRNHLDKWNETDLPPEYEFPWMQLGFIVLAFGIAAPFAWIAYKKFAVESDEYNEKAAPPTPRKRSKPVE